MLSSKFSYQVPENIIDQELKSRYRHFNTCCQLTVLTMVVIVTANKAFDLHQAQLNSVVFLFIFAAICTFFFSGIISLTSAVNLYIGAGAGQVAVSAFVTGGFTSPVLFWCILIPLYAFWLLNRKYALFWFLVSMALPTIFLAMSFLGINYAHPYNFFLGDHRYFALTIIIFLILNIFIVGNSFETNKADSLKEVNFVNKELRDALIKLEEIKRDLESAEKHKDLFIAQMSHEMRTPMTAIIGVSELLHTQSHDGQEELLQILDRSSKHLLYIVDDILDITKIQTGKFHYQKTIFRLVPLIHTVYNTNKLHTDEKGIDFFLGTDENLPELFHGDPFRITQILNNILSNAIKFTHRGTVKLQVGFNDPEKLLLITVSDTGIGMSKTEVSKVFAIFSQANAEIHLRYGGTGMGLSITKQLVELFGGKISIRSRIGVGSMVTIALPADLNHSNSRETADMRLFNSELRNKMKSVRILVAEDNDVNQLVIKRILQSELPDSFIDLASDGNEVLVMIEKSHYDVILMDIQMPNKNGIETTKIIRNNILPAIAKMKIIALTASARKSEAENCLANGMDGYASKPIDKDELLSKIYQLISN